MNRGEQKDLELGRQIQGLGYRRVVVERSCSLSHEECALIGFEDIAKRKIN